jgi:hypothetical protein
MSNAGQRCRGELKYNDALMLNETISIEVGVEFVDR